MPRGTEATVLGEAEAAWLTWHSRPLLHVPLQRVLLRELDQVGCHVGVGSKASESAMKLLRLQGLVLELASSGLLSPAHFTESLAQHVLANAGHASPVTKPQQLSGKTAT